MEIFQDTDYVYSDVYGDFYEDNFLRAIVAIVYLIINNLNKLSFHKLRSI